MDNKCGSIKKWKIFYSDGFKIWTYSCEDGPPENAPADFVQVIIMEDPEIVWLSQTGTDYYIWDDRGTGFRWWGVNYDGLTDYWRKTGYQKVIRGYTLSSKIFTDIFNLAQNDPMFGRKIAFRRREKRPDDT